MVFLFFPGVLIWSNSLYPKVFGLFRKPNSVIFLQSTKHCCANGLLIIGPRFSASKAFVFLLKWNLMITLVQLHLGQFLISGFPPVGGMNKKGWKSGRRCAKKDWTIARLVILELLPTLLEAVNADHFSSVVRLRTKSAIADLYASTASTVYNPGRRPLQCVQHHWGSVSF